MEKGKSLESKFQKWCKELELYCERFFDSRSFGRVGSNRPSDYWVYIYPQLFLVECKETQEKCLAFDSIRPSQWKAARKSFSYKYVYLFLIKINKKLFFITAKDILKYVSETERKSISGKDIEKIGQEINNKNEMKIYFENQKI